jgi:class 3 adenylate cyclase/tetratricopeptide (TPR) repeat protein
VHVLDPPDDGQMTDSISPTLPGGAQTEPVSELRTFLFADIRGYTRFTQEHGDEAAARLVTKFAALIRDGVRNRGGRVLELRGDEVLVVFASARQALRAAVDLQARFLAQTRADPTLPLPVGMGIDAGEAIPVEGGYRGEALNLAARLCNLAGPGEVLASEGVVYLGRRVQGVSYAERGLVPLKGFADPVRVIRVVRDVRPVAAPLVEAVGSDHDGANERHIEPPLPIGGFLGSLPSGVLVGRELEWARIMAAMESVMAGSGRVVLLAGEPGIGKTRLAQEVTLKARHWNFTVAAGRCYEQEQAVPYYPFLEVLLSLYQQAPPAIRAEIPRRWPHLGRLLPDEIGLLPAPAALGTLEAQEDQQRLFRAVAGFIEALAEEAPVAILLDDIHWADDSTIKLLLHLARYTRGQRVLVVGTYRDVEVHRQHPLEAALLELSREGLVDDVEVRRLDQIGTGRLMTEIIGEDEELKDLVELVYRRTDGNAFFIQEVLRALVDRGDFYRREDGRWERRKVTEMEVPKSVRSVIGQRLSRLGERAQEILREASVLGQTFTFDDLLGLTQHAPPIYHDTSTPSEDEIEAALEQAIGAGLIRQAGDETYAFNHALTQQSLYAELPPRRRKRLHLAAGRALEALPDRTRQRLAGELAWHFLEGDDAEQALPYVMLAGDQAEAVFANGDAERHYRTALDLAQELSDEMREMEALEKLAAVLTRGARYERALALLEEAARMHATRGDREGELCTVAQMGHVHYLRGTQEEGLRRLKPLVEELDSREPSYGLAALWAAYARLHVGTGENEGQLQAADRALQLAHAIADHRESSRLVLGVEVTRADALWGLGQRDETLRMMEEIIPRAEAAGDLETLSRALGNTAQYYAQRGELTKDRHYHERALEVSERRGDRGYIVLWSMALSDNAFITGDWESSRAYLDRAEAIIRTLSVTRLATWPTAARGWLALRQGDLDEAARQGGAALELAGSSSPAWRRLVFRLLAELDLLAGRPEAAKSWLAPALEHSGWKRDVAFLRTRASTALALGQVEEARLSIDAAVDRARGQLNLPDLVEALVVQGSIMRVQGDAACLPTLHEAVLTAREMPFPYGEGVALLEYGLTLKEMGETEVELLEGVPERPLEEAIDIFERLGATLDAARARAALPLTGTSPEMASG